jgi:hypothetical protein
VNDLKAGGLAGFGVRFNRWERGAAMDDCPTWATEMQKREWRERGVLLWQDDTRRLVRLQPESAVKCLEQLRSTVSWAAEGCSVTRKVAIGRFKKSSRRGKRKAAIAGGLDESVPQSETFDEEIIRLSPVQAGRLLALLEEHEGQLREMAEYDQERKIDALAEWALAVMRRMRDGEMAENRKLSDRN